MRQPANGVLPRYQCVETENIAEVGDAIITGPEGDRYIIEAAAFAQTYRLSER